MKKKILLGLVELTIIGLFALLAVRCSAEDALEFVGGYNCGVNGVTNYVGIASSKTDCAQMCYDSGYRNQYCITNAGNCFCN